MSDTIMCMYNIYSLNDNIIEIETYGRAQDLLAYVSVDGIILC